MKTNLQILFVINPFAGNTAKEKLIEYVTTYCKKHSIQLKTVKITSTDDDKLIKSLLEKHHFDRVWVAGGDGTIHKMVKMVIDYPVILGIFPEGSANGLALNLKIPDTQEEQLRVALSDKTLSLDVLKMNNDICIHIADIGVNAELIENFEEGNIRGKVGYALKSIPTLLNTTYPFTFEINVNSNIQTKEGAALVIANARKYGTGATVNPLGEMDDGKFEIILFKNLNFIEIIKTLSDINSLNPDFAEVISTNKAEIVCKSPVPFQIDGDYIGKLSKLNVSVLKKKVSVAVPENNS
ncbi:diacylglycerol/lipid kinase family protein [Planktosalinus lacus]|uniref:Diacylglycerol kinase n=1 Tax=Planktosalinus lacus TaxID=1526573 RepID=A0A8J2YAJ2_9FLAO|nr:diacylglycerol kinase family protein [Planktosalinus lacus]GGD93854.1 diacylglycerol kinase [Planktosalinus lacus]